MKRATSTLSALIAVDKPSGMTSHDVVAKVRRATGERRVGHAGTLDPAATGVMVVGIGPATRLMQFASAEQKSYVAHIVFGSQTNTDDAEGEVVATAPVASELLNASFAQGILNTFLGTQLQVPPAFSAISKDGVRAYAKARAGEQVELEPRPIEVYSAELLSAYQSEGTTCWDVAFFVSKGTYIRALARDLGRAAQSCAHLGALRRSASGAVSLANCTTLEALSALRSNQADTRTPLSDADLAPLALNPLRVLGYAVRTLTDKEEELRLTGAHLPVGSLFELPTVYGAGNQRVESPRVSLVHNGRLVGVWRQQQGELVCEVNLSLGAMAATL